jgi:hypothetical protein
MFWEGVGIESTIADEEMGIGRRGMGSRKKVLCDGACSRMRKGGISCRSE